MKDKTSPRMSFYPGGTNNNLSVPCRNSISLRPTDQFEVHKIIRSLKNFILIFKNRIGIKS